MFGLFGKQSVGVKVEGDKELVAALDGMNRKLRTKIVRAAGRRVMRPILQKAREIVPVDEGQLKQSLAISVRAKRGAIIAAVKTTRRERKRKGKKRLIDGYYGVFVEYGHEIGRAGISRKRNRLKFKLAALTTARKGRVPAKPFIAPAWDLAGDDRINERFQSEVLTELQKVWDARAQPSRVLVG